MCVAEKNQWYLKKWFEKPNTLIKVAHQGGGGREEDYSLTRAIYICDT